MNGLSKKSARQCAQNFLAIYPADQMKVYRIAIVGAHGTAVQSSIDQWLVVQRCSGASNCVLPFAGQL
jgi:hypothetical protein